MTVEDFFKKLIGIIFQIAIFLLVAVFFSVLAFEWASGCGESYVDAWGDSHQYECIWEKWSSN